MPNLQPVGRKSETPSDECNHTKSSQPSQLVMVIEQDRFHDQRPSMRRKAFHFSDLRALPYEIFNSLVVGKIKLSKAKIDFRHDYSNSIDG